MIPGAIHANGCKCSICQAEQLNEPTEPTQQQIDYAFIRKMMLLVCECHHWFNNQSPSGVVWKSPLTMVQVIEDLKGDPEWRRHFKRMTSYPTPWLAK